MHTFPESAPACLLLVEITDKRASRLIFNATGTAYVIFFFSHRQSQTTGCSSGTPDFNKRNAHAERYGTLGTAGVDASSGYNINTTRTGGKWAYVCLQCCHLAGVRIGWRSAAAYSAIYKSIWQNLGKQYADIIPGRDNPRQNVT